MRAANSITEDIFALRSLEFLTIARTTQLKMCRSNKKRDKEGVQHKCTMMQNRDPMVTGATQTENDERIATK